MAVNGEAVRLGLNPGELLADARARVPLLETGDANSAKDLKALERLARWCGRFSPYIAPWTEERPPHVLHGLCLDSTGCAHLFGGEDALAGAILHALQGLGLEARLTLADTIGAAHALVSDGKDRCRIVPSGNERNAIKPLPVAALRLSPGISIGLSRVGLKKIGDLIGLPRASLTKRFGPELVQRLEQALGQAPEPLSPLLPQTPYRARAVLAEPISLQDHILTLIEKLVGDVAPALLRDGKGARALLFTLFRVDGETAEIFLRMAEATNDPKHIARLFALKLDAISEGQDVGFGYEAARLDVLTAEKLAAQQADIGSDDKGHEAHLPLLIDKLGSRLGTENIERLYPYESHIPERAVSAREAALRTKAHTNWESVPSLPRPLTLLQNAEPAEVMALLPEAPPPRQFRWRGVLHMINTAQGPERIRPEWWHGEPARTRDYYIVEDEKGRRFWLYRDGLYDEPAAPCWFVHGVFA